MKLATSLTTKPKPPSWKKPLKMIKLPAIIRPDIALPPALRLSIALVFLTLSILLIAQAIGLTPDAHRQQIDARQSIVEATAIQGAIAIKRGDGFLLQALLKTLASRNEEVQSAAIRGLDNTLLLQSGDHQKHWTATQKGHSTPTHAQLPIIVSGKEQATLEISFLPLQHKSEIMGIPGFIVLMLFIAASGFVGYWFFIGRALRTLVQSFRLA